MFTTTYTDVLSGLQITPAFPQYEFVNLNENLILSWPAQFQNINKVVAVTMVVVPTANNFTLTMPDARQAGKGFRFTIKNASVYSFELRDNVGALITAIDGGTIWEYWLDNNTTQAGAWTQTPYIQGTPVVTSINATSSSDNLVIGGVPITTAGTITFALARDLARLTSFGGSSGIAVRQDENNWFLRQIAGTANQISVMHPTGVGGNPTVSLVADVVIGNSLTAGNLKLGPGNTLSSTNADGKIELNPNGTGKIELSANTDLSASSALKFIGVNNTNYISFAAGVTSVNQAYTWPTVAPLPGQVLGYSDSGGGLLSWLTVITTGGTTDTDAIARYANTTGGLKNSAIFIDDARNITNAGSLRVGTIGISTSGSANRIITTVSDQNLDIVPNGNGSLVSRGDIKIFPSLAGSQRKLSLYNPDATFFSGFIADPATNEDTTWKLPVADSAGVFISDGAKNLSINPYFMAGTNNVVPTFTATPGLLQNSSLSLVGGAATGLTSISTVTNNDLNLIPNGTGNVISQTDLQIKSAGNQRKLQLWNAAGTFFSGLQSNAVSNLTFTLPTAFPASAAYVRCDAAGNLSAATAITSVVNGIPKFFDTTGLMTNTGSYIDGNNNLSIGTTTIGTTGSGTITLPTGSSVTAISATFLSIATRNTGTGNVLALFGGGDGGISASVTNTITHKISIFVNGTRYYLLASTSSA